MDEPVVGRLLSNFLIALGVTLGGTLSGAAASLLVGGHPMDRLRFLSDEMRLWAILIAMSGSFEPLRGLEQGIFGLDPKAMGRQMLYLVTAMAGAHMAYVLLQRLAGPKA